ncbi:5-formyltetrahydrofolate cyclo-ligase [Roseomonas sp. KE2513]|uniref:5-formyltetrahydrofolate cyclo-ligase n=1 Tax=Roseomonas sp. KE2513 TaxID=2479202 RepID=UPI0018DF4AB5|nr:5-formyltetrahydrofolate cyclo-ligase [Roseomonas sp. KE2513]MBI0534066.1 5-formyltetrahydrofolate cyclo-ligase [Roseomonas sp. KE2513]
MSGGGEDPRLRAAKVVAREEAQARRASAQAAGTGPALCAHVLREAPPPAGAVVAGFWPMGHEIDIRPLLRALEGRGHRLCLPRTPKRGLPLDFRAFAFGDAMDKGPFGTLQPSAEAAPLTPGFVIVPLLAFDRAGRRLGYGGGYYDRTLAALPGVPTLGVAFACQQMDEVPAGPLDAPLDAVATEAGVMRF